MRIAATSRLFALAAILGLSSTVAACSNWDMFSERQGMFTGVPMSGLDAYKNGDYKKAAEIFEQEYKDDPSDIYVQFNLADAYNALGARDKAIPLYQKVAANGKNVIPDGLMEPHNAKTTFTDVACTHLRELAVQDSNCN